MIDEHYQIGEVAERVGLSLRTIRYYEEIELVNPSGRTEGGFRLYTDADVERLRLIRALKPLGMSLETLGELLRRAEELETVEETERPEAEGRLEAVLAVALDRCDHLEERLTEARSALRNLSIPSARESR